MRKSTKGRGAAPTQGKGSKPRLIGVPRPTKIGDGTFARNFYSYAEVVDFIDKRAGRPPRDLSETDRVRLITAREFRHLLGDVSEMFLWRLLNKDRAAAA
jgi:hypothetical protein